MRPPPYRYRGVPGYGHALYMRAAWRELLGQGPRVDASTTLEELEALNEAAEGPQVAFPPPTSGRHRSLYEAVEACRRDSARRAATRDA